MAESKKRKSSYVPVPKADPETLRRLQVMVLSLSGQLHQDQAATMLGMSRLSFQKLRNRMLNAAIEELIPRPCAGSAET